MTQVHDEKSDKKNPHKISDFKCAGALVTSINPTTNEMMLLLGQEGHNPGWSVSDRWSDFVGDPKEKVDATILDTVRREWQQETLGIHGSDAQINELISEGEHFIVPLSCTTKHAYIVVVLIPFEEKLPVHYNNMYTFLKNACSVQHPRWKHFKHIPSCDEGVMEKVKLEWHPLKHVLDVKNADQYRSHFFTIFELSISKITLFKKIAKRVCW